MLGCFKAPEGYTPCAREKGEGAVLAKESPVVRAGMAPAVCPQLWGRDLCPGAGVIQTFHKAWQQGSLVPWGRLRAWAQLLWAP